MQTAKLKQVYEAVVSASAGSNAHDRKLHKDTLPLFVAIHFYQHDYQEAVVFLFIVT